MRTRDKRKLLDTLQGLALLALVIACFLFVPWVARNTDCMNATHDIEFYKACAESEHCQINAYDLRRYENATRLALRTCDGE